MAMAAVEGEGEDVGYCTPQADDRVSSELHGRGAPTTP